MADEMIQAESTRLTNPDTLALMVKGLQANAFELTPEDVQLLSEVEMLVINGPEDWARGYDLLASMNELERTVKQHYDRFRLPLNKLIVVVRDMERTVMSEVDGRKTGLSKRLGNWKIADDARRAREAADAQRQADERARAAQQAKADALRQLAETSVDAQLAKVFQTEADMVASVPAVAAAVPVQEAPKVKGHVRTTWHGQVTDVRTLLRAWLEGECFIPEELMHEAIQDGLSSFLDKQAASLREQLARAYPGTLATPKHTAISVRK
jgi:hypothetical protein